MRAPARGKFAGKLFDGGDKVNSARVPKGILSKKHSCVRVPAFLKTISPLERKRRRERGSRRKRLPIRDEQLLRCAMVSSKYRQLEYLGRSVPVTFCMASDYTAVSPGLPVIRAPRFGALQEKIANPPPPLFRQSVQFWSIISRDHLAR